MLCLPKITACKTVSEVILDTLSKLLVIPQYCRHLLILLLHSATSLASQRFMGMWSAKCFGGADIWERYQQQPLSAPSFSSEDFEMSIIFDFVQVTLQGKICK